VGYPATTMPSYGACDETVVDAPPEACYAALADTDGLTAWQGALKAARVLERDDEGRASAVEFEVDAKVRTVRYRLRQVHEPPHRLASEYLGGDFRDFAGAWTFRALPDGRTCARLDLRIDPGRFVPGPVRSLITDAVLRRALSDLRMHFAADRVGHRA
jgi:ribosome-associated toxin RatA of RatAB toxin-antitoxin module